MSTGCFNFPFIVYSKLDDSTGKKRNKQPPPTEKSVVRLNHEDENLQKIPFMSIFKNTSLPRQGTRIYAVKGPGLLQGLQTFTVQRLENLRLGFRSFGNRALPSYFLLQACLRLFSMLYISHHHLFPNTEGCMGQRQNIRGRNLKLMIKECTEHCRSEGDNRTVNIQRREDCRILSSRWRERREKVRAYRLQ